MERATDAMETMIPKGRTLRIQDGKGLNVEVVSGSVWVAYAHDIEDVVVDAGETLCVGRNGLTLAHAVKETRLRLAAPAEAGAPNLTLGGGYREFGSGIAAAMIAGWTRGLRDRFAVAVAQRDASRAAAAAHSRA